MKRIIPTLVTMLFAAGGAGAQNGMDVKNIRMIRGGGEVTLSFELSTGAGTVHSRNTLIVTPVMTDGNAKAIFPAVAVQGRVAARKAVEAPPAAQVIRAGESVGYTARIPYSEWMPGADLRLEGVRIGCGEAAGSSDLLAGNVLWHEPQYAIEIVEIQPEPVVTTAEKLSRQFSFLQPAGESKILFGETPPAPGKRLSAAQRNELENLIANSREGSIKIHFRVNSKSVDEDYLDNHRSLVELISVIRAIEASGTDRISRVVIAGFASPEGDAALNDRLAWDRATSLKQFLTDHSTIDPPSVYLFNGSVDWPGLRELVAASDMPEKRQVLEIIDNVPVWDARAGRGRRGELMRLKQGEPYRYISREFFPLMRQASFIKVYYEKM